MAPAIGCDARHRGMPDPSRCRPMAADQQPIQRRLGMRLLQQDELVSLRPLQELRNGRFFRVKSAPPNEAEKIRAARVKVARIMTAHNLRQLAPIFERLEAECAALNQDDAAMSRAAELLRKQR